MSASHPGEPPPPLDTRPFSVTIQTSAQTFDLTIQNSTTVKELKQMIIGSVTECQNLYDTDGRMYLILHPWDEMERMLDVDEFVMGTAGVKEGDTIAVVTRPIIKGEGKDFEIEYKLV
ncbi:hypothetical protein CB0940_11657 [Cercospora beticola]|uniref:Ubiquitin-like domain-containing protein n=1 Tax=Cercospora beticola TaxID=122368 RepID=A0A2G5IEP1_CERBT|nr:hypothetical protein CB0940_11657 [Cercospora beticola]PIB03249.1 hypothetical protein CB0940_11657 [Cercospora beticola]WPB04007.1 hypothetical protein RHO25_008651 [Cercospora beticola]CAK1357200.1 unnamed protein product [Cercospora beticola]